MFSKLRASGAAPLPAPDTELLQVQVIKGHDGPSPSRITNKAAASGSTSHSLSTGWSTQHTHTHTHIPVILRGWTYNSHTIFFFYET